jgi:hypothetical protein
LNPRPATPTNGVAFTTVSSIVAARDLFCENQFIDWLARQGTLTAF